MKFLNFERILTELRSEKFEWFGPSPIELFNSGPAAAAAALAAAREATGPGAAWGRPRAGRGELRGAHSSAAQAEDRGARDEKIPIASWTRR